MADFLFELLLALLEPILEAILELIAGAIPDLISRLLSGGCEALASGVPVAATLTYTLLGRFAGGCSVMIIPHTSSTHSGFRVSAF